MSKDDFGDRMKIYEMQEAGRLLLPLLPICVRLDGRSFSKFTKGMERPYDKRFSDVMIEVTKYLVSKTNACIGYTQSDEISLILYSNIMKNQTFFERRIQKLVSVLSSMATAKLNELIRIVFPEKAKQLPVFDCRVWNVPTLIEAVNTILWREKDATKNSVSMAASFYYSHKELMNKSDKEKQEMLFTKGINWNDYPIFFKRGTFIQRIRQFQKFSSKEIEKLPPKHLARTNPDLVIERHSVKQIEMPSFTKVTNRIDVIFNGQKPLIV